MKLCLYIELQRFVLHLFSTTHPSIDMEDVYKRQGLIRISCGLEDKADLIADIAQALDAI